MLREPSLKKAAPEAGPSDKQPRFKLVKLEERIAPRRGKHPGGCHYNPQGKLVGCGKQS